MEISSIAGSLLAMNLGQTQAAMSASLVKMAANQQNQLADILAQNAQQAPQASAAGGQGFSTYA